MLTRERKEQILALLQRDGRVVAKTFSQDIGVSEDTVRRDLRELAAEGLLQRVHGGALPASAALAPLDVRAGISVEGKQAIARVAAGMVRPGQLVMLDGGTTALQIVRHLPASLEVTVVTHSPAVAMALAGHPRAQVELIGGRLFRHSMVAVGAAAVEMVSRIRADIYFMGVTGIHPEIGLTTGDNEEAAIKRAFSRQAAETVVLASREKLGAVSRYSVAGLGEIDAMIVEGDVADPVFEAYRAQAVVLIPA